jgi:hypothetical protein
VLRASGLEYEEWPDGRPLLDQPLLLIRAWSVVSEYLAANRQR